MSRREGRGERGEGSKLPTEEAATISTIQLIALTRLVKPKGYFKLQEI